MQPYEYHNYNTEQKKPSTIEYIHITCFHLYKMQIPTNYYGDGIENSGYIL